MSTARQPPIASLRSHGRLALSVAALLGAALLGAACEHKTAKHAPRAKGPVGTVTLDGASLDYVRVEPAAVPANIVQRPLMSRVTFDERRVAILGAPVSGRVAAVAVVTGTMVKAGTPLIIIHSADIAAARSQVAQAREARMLGEQRYARSSLLVKQGAGSEAEVQEANTALASARTEEQRANATLGALGGAGSASDYVLRSPIAGEVVERMVDVGNAVGADQGQPLITVADLSTVWIVADVYEHDLPYIRAGQVARVTAPALRDRVYEGTVEYVGSVVDATTRTARARVVLENHDGTLRPGMFANMVVDAREDASAVVPVSALLARRDDAFVFVQTSAGHFEQRPVKVGAQVGDKIALLTGVKPGEHVVTRGAILLDAEANAAF